MKTLKETNQIDHIFKKLTNYLHDKSKIKNSLEIKKFLNKLLSYCNDYDHMNDIVEVFNNLLMKIKTDNTNLDIIKENKMMSSMGKYHNN